MTDTQELCGAKTSRGFNQTTAHGRAFYALDPRPEEVFIDDIAAQLSRICRFGGALKEHVDLEWAEWGRNRGTWNYSCHAHESGEDVRVIAETYSVAQHSVLVADNVPEPYKLRALLHDAAEAYVGDVIKPIKAALTPSAELIGYLRAAEDKLNGEGLFAPWQDRSGYDRPSNIEEELLRLIPNFSRIERNVQAAILNRFGLPLEDEEADWHIKIADYRAVLTEHRDLQIDNGAVDWGVPKHPPFDERVVPLLPSAARALFLQRFNELYKGE